MGYYNKPFSIDLIFGFIRSAIRVTTVIILIILNFLIFIPLQALLPERARNANRRRFQCFLMKGILRLLGCRIIRKGPRPGNSVFFVANHLGVVDVFTVMAETGARLVAKDSLRRIPVFGYLMEKYGVIFIKRHSLSDMKRVAGEMADAYRKGEGVAFFPEGTTSQGEGIRELLGALFLPAAECQAPVHYATIRFEVPSSRWPLASVSVCEVGGANFIKHLIRLCYLPRIEIYITYGEKPVAPTNRKALVREVEKRMVAQFEPMEQMPREEQARFLTPVAKESQALKARPFIT